MGLTLTTTVGLTGFVPDELPELEQVASGNVADRVKKKATGIQNGRRLPVRRATILLVENEPARLAMAFRLWALRLPSLCFDRLLA